MSGDRNEQATPHRREKARKEGDILYSRDMTSAIGMLSGVLALGLVNPKLLDAFRQCFAASLELGSDEHWQSATVLPTLIALRRVSVQVLIPVGIIGMMISLAACVAAILQTGGIQIHTASVGPGLNRINPSANLKNLFSTRAASRLGKSLIPVSFLTVFAVQRIARELDIHSFSENRVASLASDVYGLLLAAGCLIAGWAIIDYVLEWRRRESRLKMSREELKQEYKETEGNPQTRGRIRSLQRQMRRRKVKADVSRAAVVLTNPTHYAVALSFDFTTMEAPRVLAKGRNLLAEEIKAEARWAGVPIVENPPLARSLYRSVEVDRPIPVDLYAAVAAILAYLYRQRVDAEVRERNARGAAGAAAGAAAIATSQPPRSFRHSDGGRK